MEDIEYIELSLNSGNQQNSISFITTLLNNAETKINHFDGLRQRNMVVAIAVFSGLSSFVIKASNEVIAISISVSLFLVMGMFFVLDRRFRTYSHGWQKTRKNMIFRIRDIINDPGKDVKFPRYDVSGEKEGRYWSVISVLYAILLVGSFLSYAAYRLSNIKNA